MKLDIKDYLYPPLAIFMLTSLAWIIGQVPFIEFIALFFGLFIGSFFLEIDHLIYWLYLQPNLEESRVAQAALAQKDYATIYKLLKIKSKAHVNLIFHHYFFQVVLALVSVFVFTSSISTFTKSFLLALNIHLLIDEFTDYHRNKKFLQEWLFAREQKQLSVNYLKHYLYIFTFLTLIFFFLLLKSNT